MPELTPDDIERIYSRLAQRHDAARKQLNRALTLTEKILFAHLHDTNVTSAPVRGQSYVLLQPDRVAMQDATAQMALLQFMQGGFDSAAVPTTVHCDHLIQARVGAQPDMVNALAENKEVFDFLKSSSAKHGIGFWQPGAGIIHQVVLENYAFPGGMMIGTDSHTPNAGGLGMIAIGVGGADAVDVMAGQPWGITWPKIIGVKLTGSLNGWAAPKDIILKLAGILTVSGGTGAIIEYFGEGTTSISCTGKATITNMGAELGATTSIFPYDKRMHTYLKATHREHIADSAQAHKEQLASDPEVAKDPGKFYDRIVEIDLSTLEPYVVGPHSPDLARPISQLAKEAKEKGYPQKLKVALIGSCTNSSYEDMSRAAEIAAQGAEHGLKTQSEFMITPGSQQIYETIMRDGQLQTLEKIGGVVLANACGPCIGQWKRDDISAGETNSIITSFNRNFARRNDGNAQTLAFIGSPELVTAMALGGSLGFNPLQDSLPAPDGSSVKLAPPKPAAEIPPNGFAGTHSGYVEPPKDRSSIQVIVSPDSKRLQLLAPFAVWDGKDFIDLPVLVKALGKCTTDHISPAGPWLAYRGHLDKISDNMFIGAVNAFTGGSGAGLDVLSGTQMPFPAVARHYKAEGLGWVVMGDTNYGEGSSREHAAMSPRYLNCKTVIVRSFARIHETNLKKQGVLALTFANPKDYDKVQQTDRISILGLAALAPGSPVKARIRHSNGSTTGGGSGSTGSAGTGATEEIMLHHTMTAEQVDWFKAGSALNLIRSRRRQAL